METLTGVRFPVGIGRAVRGVRGGYSLRFSDKLAMSSRKNQKRAVIRRRSVQRALRWMVGVVRRGAAGVSHGQVRTRREQERTRTAYRRSTRVGSVPSSDRSMPTVLLAWPRLRQSGQADSLPEAGERTERKDRSGRRSWTFDREPDHGNALMIRAIQNPVRGYGCLTM